MTALALDLLTAALALPEKERLDLATRLLDSVHGETEPGWEESWAAELDRREEAAARDGDAGRTWSEVKAEIDRRLARVEREGVTGVDWEDVYAEMTAEAP